MTTRVHEPRRRTQWEVAPEGAAWASCKAGDVTPAAWHGWVGPSVLLLKDTRKATFVNRLGDDGRTFFYELPPPKSAAQDATMAALHREADAAAKTVEVRLFSVECARNFYLGEFVIDRIERSADGRTYACLQRLAEQDTQVRQAYEVSSRPKRSRSESMHADAIRSILPGWRLVHEPECVAFYESELVVDGRMREWGGDQYVCDYVAARGCARVCFESKASAAGFDEAAKLKCRALRDRSLTRVVALVGHGAEAMRWHDFGCPAGDGEEASGSGVEALRERLACPPHTPPKVYDSDGSV